MDTINLSKPTFLILFLVVAGIGLTIGAASAVMVFTDNLQVDNGAGNSQVEITSATCNSKLTLTDQGEKKYAIILKDGKKKLLIKDVSKGETRLTLKDNGNLGIGTKNPTSRLHVVGDFTLESSILCTGCIDTTDIADGSILTEDLAPSSIQIYEVSETFIAPNVFNIFTPVSLSCLDGDWMNFGGGPTGTNECEGPKSSVDLVTNPSGLPVELRSGGLPGKACNFLKDGSKVVGLEGFVESSVQTFDYEIIATILCFSPSS